MSHLLDRLNFFQSKELEQFLDGWGQTTPENRDWEDVYRNRWRQDKVVRSTHGVNCTESCSWKIYVKSGIVTWETQQTDYPCTRNHEPCGCARGASYSWYLYSANRVKNPLIRGTLTRAGSGWIADKFGGGRVTLWGFVVMILGTIGVLYFLGIKEQSGAFYGFFAMFLLLFAATGVGNASTFQMSPTIFWQNRKKALAGKPEEEVRKAAERESAAVIGFSSAIGAFGAFFIPKSYGTSIAATGGPDAALWIFVGFYTLCLYITWFFYTRRNAEIKC